MKRLAARGIIGAFLATLATSIGASIRGPLADESLPADFAIGIAFLGAAAAIRWAFTELEGEQPA